MKGEGPLDFHPSTHTSQVQSHSAAQRVLYPQAQNPIFIQKAQIKDCE